LRYSVSRLFVYLLLWGPIFVVVIAYTLSDSIIFQETRTSRIIRPKSRISLFDIRKPFAAGFFPILGSAHKILYDLAGILAVVKW